MTDIYKCLECERYFTEDEIETKEICLEEELGVLGDFSGRTYKKIECCPYCQSGDIEDFREVDQAEEIIDILNRARDRMPRHQRGEYLDMISKELVVVGNKGMWMSMNKFNEHNESIKKAVAKEIAYLIYENTNTKLDFINLIKERYGVE